MNILNLENKTVVAAFLICPVLGYCIFHYDTLLVIGAILGLGLLATMVIKPEFATTLVFFALYANLPVVLIKHHGVPQLVAGSFILLLGLPFVSYVFLQKRGVVLDQTMLLLTAYFCVLLVSASLSGNFEESVDRLLGQFLEGVLLYFLVVNTVRKLSELRKATWALLFAGIFMGSLSMYQEFTGDYDNTFGGLAVTKESGISTGEIDLAGDKIKRRRLSGPIGSKNRYAQIMVVLLPLAFFRLRGDPSRWLRVVAAIGCVPILAGALLTFSRGAGIAIFLILIIMMFMRYIRVRHFLVALLFCVVVVAVAIPDYIYRSYKAFTSISSVASANIQEADGAVRGRATVNLAALNIFLDHPIFGVGPGQTRLHTTEYSARVGFRRITGTRRAHNMYLEELADTGAIGFVLLFSIVGNVLLRLSRLRRRCLRDDSRLEHYASGFFLAIIAYLLTAMFLHLSYVRFYWVVVALGCAAIHILEHELNTKHTKDSAAAVDDGVLKNDGERPSELVLNTLGNV